MMLSFEDSCREMWDWIVQYSGGFPAFICLSVVACVYFIVTSKSFRKKLLLPIIVLVVLVLNPLMYSLLYGNNNLPFVNAYGLRYWRFLWMLPQGILISAFALSIVKRMRHPAVRCIGLLVAAAIIMLAGKNIYLDETEFTPAGSAYKISPTVQKVCEAVLTDNPEPLCMFENTLSTQAREYSGSIRQLWGRNGTWNVIPDAQAWEIYNLMREKERDWERIFGFAEQRGVTHIAYRIRAKEDEEQMLATAAQHGFQELERIENRIILHRVT